MDQGPDKPYHKEPAYWQMVQENTDALFGELDRKDRARKRNLIILLFIAVVIAGSYLLGAW